MSEESLNEVLERLRERILAGDRTAYRKFVHCAAPIVQFTVGRVLLCWGLRGDGRLKQEKEDLMAETFLRLFRDDAAALRRWEKKEGNRSLANWVRLIAKSKALEWVRSRKRPAPLAGDAADGEAEGSASNPESRYADRDLLRRVIHLVETTFDEGERTLFCDWFVKGCSAKEIGAKLGIREANTVQKRISRLRRKLRRLIKALEGRGAAADGDDEDGDPDDDPDDDPDGGEGKP